MVVMAAQQCECTQRPSTIHLKIVKVAHFMPCPFYHDFLNWAKDLNRHFPKEGIRARKEDV